MEQGVCVQSDDERRENAQTIEAAALGAQEPTETSDAVNDAASADTTSGRLARLAEVAATPATAVAAQPPAPSAPTTSGEQPAPLTEGAPTAPDAAGTSANGARAEAPTRPFSTPAAKVDAASADAPLAGADDPTTAPSPLAPGTLLGYYRIEAIVRADVGGQVYLASLADEDAGSPADGGDEAEAPRMRFTVTELPEPASATLGALVTLGLQHPRLLAPLTLLEEAGRTYLVTQSLDATADSPATAEVGASLTPIEGLRAGAGLADALSYLHRNGVAHLHVAPDAILTQDARAYLIGLETASLVDWNSPDTNLLFARDANFLARTLGALVGLPATPEPTEGGATLAIREIALRGEAGVYTSPDEVGAACGAALHSFGLDLENLGTGEAQAASATTRLLFTTGSATTVGRVRSQNQDALAVTVFDLRDDVTYDSPLAVFLVSDGMGGEAHGEIASRITARAVTVEMTRHFTLPRLLWPILSLEDIISDESTSRESQPADVSINANTEATNSSDGRLTLAQALEQAVAEANRQTRVFARMLNAATGATLTVIAASGAHAALAHLGDSRAYLLRDMRLIRLTEDHSLLARLIAIDHPLLSDPSFVAPRSVLYRSIGQEDEAPPDLLEFTLSVGDRLLLCSDGMWDELDDQTIGQELAQAINPQVCAERLIALANQAGGHDNSTAVVIFVAAEEPANLAAQDAPTDALAGAPQDDADAPLEDAFGFYQPYTPDTLNDALDAPLDDPTDPADPDAAPTDTTVAQADASDRHPGAAASAAPPETSAAKGT